MLKKVFFALGIILAVILAGGLFYAIVVLTPGGSSSTQSPHPANSENGGNDEEKGHFQTGATSSHQPAIEIPLPNSYFKLAVESHNTINETGIQKVDADMEIKYSRQKTNDSVLLTFHSLAIKMVQGGTVTDDVIMTRDKRVDKSSGQMVETSVDEMPSDQRDTMLAAFGTALCKIHLDKCQNELGREILSDAGYAMLQDGNINSLQLMHGPFCAGQQHWSATKRIPMTAGFVFDCPVDYESVHGKAGEVKVAGRLKKDEVVSEQSEWVVKNVDCRIEATELFDEASNDYVSGKINLTYKFEVHRKEGEPVKMDGSIDLTLEKISNQKAR